MQYLLNKNGLGKYSFATHGAHADAYSPFAEHINDIENKRSKLFPDRMRIPGRKTKYILTIAYLIHLYAFMKVLQAKKIYGLKDQQQSQFFRKSAPYFGSIETVQYTILKHRWDLLAKQVLGEEFLKKTHFHNPQIGWQNMGQSSYPIVRHGLDRYVVSPQQNLFRNYWNGFEIQNI